MPKQFILSPEQLEVINDSDAVCEGCGAAPREAKTMDGWFIDSVLDETGTAIAQIRCPQCW
jgi:hypothetical protein